MRSVSFVCLSVNLTCFPCLPRVWGAGPATAERWYVAGARSLADVAALPHHITEVQAVGLKYFEDFQQRIPRAEVEGVVKVVERVVLEVLQVGGWAKERGGFEKGHGRGRGLGVSSRGRGQGRTRERNGFSGVVKVVRAMAVEALQVRRRRGFTKQWGRRLEAMRGRAEMGGGGRGGIRRAGRRGGMKGSRDQMVPRLWIEGSWEGCR